MSQPSDPSASKPHKDLKGGDSFTLPQLPGGQIPQNMGLADLARGLQYVVNETAMAAYLHTQKTLDLYFDAEGNPLCRRVRLPGGAGVIDVPKLALTPPANLLLDQMEVSLAVRITNLTPASEITAVDPVDSEAGEPAVKVRRAEPHIFVAPPDAPDAPDAPTEQASAAAPETQAAQVSSSPSAALDAQSTQIASPSSAASAASSAETGSGPTEDARSRATSGQRKARAHSFAMDAERFGEASGPERRSLDRLSFEIQPAPVSPDAAARRDANVMDIKMIFRRSESPEGVARLVSLFTEAMFRVKPAE